MGLLRGPWRYSWVREPSIWLHRLPLAYSGLGSALKVRGFLFGSRVQVFPFRVGGSGLRVVFRVQFQVHCLVFRDP